jgi:superfamily II DNA or RNA helicase
MAPFTPRYFQNDAVTATMDYWKAGGGNALVEMATGTGKSPTIGLLTKLLMTTFPGFRILMLVHVKELVEQNALALLKFWPTAPIGINSAGIGRRDTAHPILYGSIQSLWRHPELLGDRDLVIIDEAHLVPKKAVGMYRSLLGALLQARPDMRICGFTATPFRLDSGRLDRGPDKLFDKVVYRYTITQGIDDGYLAPLVPLRMDNEMDVSGLRRAGGDFTDATVAAAADNDAVIQAAAKELVQHGENRRSWLSFCCGVEHAEKMRDATTALGITSATITGTTSNVERAQIIAGFKSGRIRHLTNAMVLCLDAKTEILTTDGWTGMNAMTDGHHIASWKENGSIVFDHPKLIVRRKLLPHERMVSLKGQNNNIRVTGNHRMIVKSHDGQWEKKSAEEIAGESVFMPVSGIAEPLPVTVPVAEVSEKRISARIRALSYVYRNRGMEVGIARKEAEKHVRRRAAMRAKNPNELTLDQCRFIGFWQGDGTLSPRCEFSQSFAYAGIIEWFDDLLVRLGYGHSKSLRPGTPQLPLGYARWSIARGTGGSCQGRDSGYFDLEPYLKKSGNKLYWGLNTEQFGALLEGFWLADGNHGTGNGNASRGTFVTGAQLQFYELLQAVGACRGYRFTLTERPAPTAINHKQQWTLSWKLATQVQLLRETMSVETDYEEEDTWCVTSSTGNIITRRSGKVVVMGNTTGFDAPQTDLVSLFRPTLSTVLYVQCLGRGTRCVGANIAESILNGKENCLVLDFAGNVRRHGPVDAVTVNGSDRGISMDDDERPTVRADDVRATPCRHCNGYNPIGTITCIYCGTTLIEDKPKHTAEAEANLVLLSRDKDPYEAIDEMRCYRHEKMGSAPTMRVEYRVAGSRTDWHKEWICFEHTGFARDKAGMWWGRLGASVPTPRTVDDALARVGELRLVTGVKVKEGSGRYKEVVGRRLDPIHRCSPCAQPHELTSGRRGETYSNDNGPDADAELALPPPGFKAWG